MVFNCSGANLIAFFIVQKKGGSGSLKNFFFSPQQSNREHFLKNQRQRDKWIHVNGFIRGSVCQTKLGSAFDKIKGLVKNFSSSVSGSWSTPVTLPFGGKWGSLIIAQDYSKIWGTGRTCELRTKQWGWIYELRTFTVNQ